MAVKYRTKRRLRNIRKCKIKKCRKHTKKVMHGSGLEEYFYGVSLDLNMLKQNYDVIINPDNSLSLRKKGTQESYNDIKVANHGVSAKDGHYYITVSNNDFNSITGGNKESQAKWRRKRNFNILKTGAALLPIASQFSTAIGESDFKNINPIDTRNKEFLRPTGSTITLKHRAAAGILGYSLKFLSDAASGVYSKLTRKNKGSIKFKEEKPKDIRI